MFSGSNRVKKMKQKTGYLAQAICLSLLFCIQAYGLFLLMCLNTGDEILESRDSKKIFIALGAILLTTMLILIFLIVSSLMRWGRISVESHLHTERSEYVNAWSEAGKRLDASVDNDDD